MERETRMSTSAVLDAIQKRIRKYTKKLRSIDDLEKRVATTPQGLNEDQKKTLASKESALAIISELDHLTTTILNDLPQLSLEEELQEIKDNCKAQFSNQLDQEIQRLTVNHTTQLQALLKLHQEQEASITAQAVAQVTDQAAKHTENAVHQAISSLISVFFLSSLFDPWANHPLQCQHERISCLTHARHSLTNTPISTQDFDSMNFLCRTMMASLYHPFQQDPATCHADMLERCVDLAVHYCSSTNTTTTSTDGDDNFRIRFPDGSTITVKEIKEKVDSIMKLDYMTAPPDIPPLSPHHPHQQQQLLQQHYYYNHYGTHNPPGTPPVPQSPSSSTTTHGTDDSSSASKGQRGNRPYRSAAPPPATSIIQQQQQQQEQQKAHFSHQYSPQYHHNNHRHGPPPYVPPPVPPAGTVMMIAPPYPPLPFSLSLTHEGPAFAAPTVVKHPPPQQANNNNTITDTTTDLVNNNKRSNGKNAQSPSSSSIATVAQQEEDYGSNIKRALQFMHPLPPPGILPPPRHRIPGSRSSPCNFKTNETNMDPIIIIPTKNAKSDDGGSTVPLHRVSSSSAAAAAGEVSDNTWRIPAARPLHPHHLADIKEGNPGEEGKGEEGPRRSSEEISRPTPFTFHTKVPLSKNSPPLGLDPSPPRPPPPRIAVVNDGPPGLSPPPHHHYNNNGSGGRLNSAGKKSSSGGRKTSSNGSGGSGSGSGRRRYGRNTFDPKVNNGGGNDNSHQYTSRPWKDGGSQAAVQAALAGIDDNIWKQQQ